MASGPHSPKLSTQNHTNSPGGLPCAIQPGSEPDDVAAPGGGKMVGHQRDQQRRGQERDAHQPQQVPSASPSSSNTPRTTSPAAPTKNTNANRWNTGSVAYRSASTQKGISPAETASDGSGRAAGARMGVAPSAVGAQSRTGIRRAGRRRIFPANGRAGAARRAGRRGTGRCVTNIASGRFFQPI